MTGLWSNDTWKSGTNGESLRTNSYTRQFLQYLYACAMPGSFDPSIGGPTNPDAQIDPRTYSIELDPSAGELHCNAAGGCDDPFYSCNSTTNTCVVPLVGSVGVGVNADGSTWAKSGKCDESCERWVSACVLARTNAYGVKVDISMRAPANAPTAIKNALAVSDQERRDYGLREGAFYGNVFGESPTGLPPTADYSGPPTSPIIAAPQFFACAGPGSNIPEITKRFCSSQGDQAVIAVPGVCLPAGRELATCEGADTSSSSPTFGAIQNCYTATSASWTGRTPFKEVVTVFLKKPISVCGNTVCEAGEEASDSPGVCPTDCHPGTWANAISLETRSSARRYLVTEDDGTAYAVSAESPFDEVMIDTTTSPPRVIPANPNPSRLPNCSGPCEYSDLVVVKYAPDGTVLWGQRFPALAEASGVIATLVNHEVVVIGHDFVGSAVWLARVTADGALASPRTTIATGRVGFTSIKTDASNNLLLVGDFGIGGGSATFGALPPLTRTGTSSINSIYAVKLTPQGDPLWAVTVLSPDSQPVTDLFSTGSTLDGDDNLVIAGWHEGSQMMVFVLDNATGTTLRSQLNGQNALFGVAADRNDPERHVYVAGNQGLMKLSADLQTVIWKTPVAGFYSYTYGPTIDSDGNILVISDFWGVANLIIGPLNPFNANHLAVSAYTPAGEFLWAKHLPIVVPIGSFGFGPRLLPQIEFDARGHVNVSSVFSGSMQVDGRLLISAIPESTQSDGFIGSFAPPPLDILPPRIGVAIDERGTQINTIPRTIIVEATSPAGAFVFYMPPTAINDGATTNVTCSQAPNTIFPIGRTTVTCTAINDLGQTSTAQFDIIVKDRLAPTMYDVPTDFVSSTATVTYPTPTAFDGADGVRPVTCSPPSGTVFTAATTIVTCSASDRSNNVVEATFRVTLEAPSDTTAPVISVPGSLTVNATAASGAIASYSVSATDNVDGTVTVACTPASGSTFPLGATTVRCTASDLAGNSALSTFTITVADTTPPAITVPSSITVTATGATGATVTYQSSAVDAIDGTVTTSCSRASGSVFPLGPTTVTCTATDARGNLATRQFQVAVVAAWTGILQPINADGSSMFKLNSTIPVKFQLTGASAAITNAIVHLRLTKVSAGVAGSELEATSTAAADTGNQFRYDSSSHNYIFNLAANTLSVGTWQLAIDLHDGVTRTVMISIKK